MKLLTALRQKVDSEIRADCVAKMKIVLLFLSLIAAVLGAGLASAETQSKPPTTQESFHIARSPAEKALDGIIRRADKDDNVIEYVLGTPYYDAKKDDGYSRLFTKKFLRAAAKKEADLVKKSCDGKYTDEICGLDSSPILCAQDFSEKGYLYRTIEGDGHKAVIYYLWVGDNPDNLKTFYRLIKVGNKWKLDGVHCGNGLKFNMD
jgi:hypothetical protein